MVVKRCVCKNAFQDARYGAGMRVANPSQKDKSIHCTSCGKDIVAAIKPKKIKKDDPKDVSGKKKKK